MSGTVSNAHALSTMQACAELKVDAHSGLSKEEVSKRLLQYGRNEIPAPPGTSFLRLILNQFEDLLVLILLGAAIISFILACLEDEEDRLTAFVEPAVILIILICNATVGVIQETNAEKAIESLKESEARIATVIRDSVQQTLNDASELVPGDIIIVSTGDRVPADCRVLDIHSATLSINQASLTGESEAVEKITEIVNVQQAKIQDKENMLFSGSLVERGKATAVVCVTGANTEIGKIAKDLNEDEEAKTPLQEKLDEFGEQLSKVIGAICIFVWLMNIGHFSDKGDWVKGAIYYFKIAVSLAVAAIPEGLPAVVTTCLALGTMKMAKKNAIVRSLPSVETLGCTTVICSDKTGTLTTNMMSVQKVVVVDSMKSFQAREYSVEGVSFDPFGTITSNGKERIAANDATLAEIGKACSLCNDCQLEFNTKSNSYSKNGTPTEAALLVLSEKIGVPVTSGPTHGKQASSTPNQICRYAYNYWSQLYSKIQTFEFDRDRKSMSVLVKDTKSNNQCLYVKGAPEGIIDRCTSIRTGENEVSTLNAQNKAQLKSYIDLYTKEGLRCIALASLNNPNVKKYDLKDMKSYKSLESDLTFIGFVYMQDPPRDNVYASIQQCKSAGIRVIVITGDNKTTAESICRNIGVFTPTENVKGKSFTGSEFDCLSSEEKQEVVKVASLFSRVEPRHKLELVSLLKDQGEVVAMTGDGVNDATALKKADIGIAMGTGTDVARESSKMILADDNFSTIVMAIEQGRAIYNNTKQFIRYLISSNIGEVACIFLTSMLGIPEALIPVQLLWVNLVTDGLPATALGFNPPDIDIMQKKPRGRTESIINGWMFFRYLVIGVYVGIGTILGYIWYFLYASNGPQITYTQLVNHHSCVSNTGLFENVDCSIFTNNYAFTASTMSLSILVTIEMFNALNALSENQSLFVVTPLSNLYVVGACILSFVLHLIIVYVPFFANIFHVAPLNAEEWYYVIAFSFPVFIIDEILKYVSRSITSSKSYETVSKKHH